MKNMNFESKKKPRVICFCKQKYIYTGVGHIIRISSKSWFISLIPFNKLNLYNVYINSTQTDIFQVFISFNFDDYNWHRLPPREGDVHHGDPGAPSLAQPGRGEGRWQGTLSQRPHLPGRAVQRHRRGLCPAVLGGRAADRGDPAHLPRRDALSTAAPGARPQSARRRGRPPASSRAAPPQAESIPWPARRASCRRAAPPASQPGPKSSRKSTKRPWRGQPGDVGICSFSGDALSQGSFPLWRAGRGIFRFCSQERAISFSSGFSGPWDDSVRRPASSLSPTTHFASNQESTVRGRHSSPRTSGQSLLGPREFGEDASERTTFCTIHPYSLSLHHHRYVDCAVGAACTASGGVAHTAGLTLAHAHKSTRLRDSVRQATSQVQLRSRDVGGSPERPCLALGDCCPPGKGRNRAGPSSREEAGVLQPLLHHTQETWWPSTNSGSASFEPGFTQAPVQDADAQAHYQMHPAPGLVCSDRPEGCLLSCFDHSATQTVPTVCVRRSGMAVQGPPLRALPVSPCVHEGRSKHPYPVTGGGCQDPQLPRRLAYPSPIQRAVGWSQGLGAPAPQPVGASGQLGKEQALPCAENLFSRCGVRLGEYDGTPHGGTCPSSAELPEFLQRQECGTTETVLEAPGAYGIRSCSHAAQIASYETTSALATLSGPEVGMVPRYTASGYHPAVSPLPQPLDGPYLSMGRGAPRTSVPAYCCPNRCLQHGLGRYMQRAGSLGALDRAPRLLWHINCLELWAVHLALWQLRPLLLGKHVLVRTDNTVLSYINRLGGIRSHCMSQLARHLRLWSHTQFKSLRAAHIPGQLNRVADALSRQLTFPGEWRLHPETIRLIWSRFGQAQVDLFASPSPPTASCTSPWPRAPSAQMHWHTVGLWPYASMRFPQWAYSHRHCANSGRTRSRSCWLRPIGPPGPGFPNSFPSR